jgi:hypothetical protein
MCILKCASSDSDIIAINNPLLNIAYVIFKSPTIRLSGFNNKGHGTKLFDEDGNESDVLKNSVEFLKEYQNHIQLTTMFCNNIKELGILEPMKADVKMADGEDISLGGFMGINREKLKALDSEAMVNLVKTDQMELIYAHLVSLGNIDSLMGKLKL